MKEDVVGLILADRKSRLRFEVRRTLRVAIVMTCCFITDGIVMVGMSAGETSMRTMILSIIVMGTATSVIWCAHMQLVKSLEVTEFVSQVIQATTRGQAEGESDNSPLK